MDNMLKVPPVSPLMEVGQKTTVGGDGWLFMKSPIRRWNFCFFGEIEGGWKDQLVWFFEDLLVIFF